MLVYMDNCAIQRPLDDKSNLMNRIEAEAVMGLFELIEKKRFELVNSEVLMYELNNTPDPERIDFGKKVLSLCKTTYPLTEVIVAKAKEFEEKGIKAIDALHLATAVINNVKYLCTCDYKFLKKALKLENIATKVILPTDLIKEVIK